MHYIKSITIISILCILTGPLTMAQEKSQKLPELNGHVFMPSLLARTSFTNTSLMTNLGIGQTMSFTIPLFEIDGEPVYGVKGSVLFTNMNVSYQQRVRDWIALYGIFSLNARISTNVQSMLSQGVNAVSSFKLGWLIKVVEKKKYILSTHIELQNYTGNFISIADFVKDIINDQPNPSISKNIPVLTGGGGIRFAYGINDVIGLRLLAGVSYGESFSRGETSVYYEIGSNVDFDFNRRYNVPMGFALGYNLMTKPEVVYVDTGYANAFSFKIAYTASPDFSLGLDNMLLLIPVGGLEEKPTVFLATLSVKYFF